MSAETEDMVSDYTRKPRGPKQITEVAAQTNHSKNSSLSRLPQIFFEWEGEHDVVLVDCSSKFMVVGELKDQCSRTVVKTLKTQFNRNGISTILHTDNSPQCAASEFRDL